MFTFVLVVVEIFECSGPHSMLYLSLWLSCLQGWSPLL